MTAKRISLMLIACALFSFRASAQSPVLTGPADGSTGSSSALTLSWDTVAGDTAYDVQVAVNSSFSNPVVNRVNLTKPSTVITGLPAHATYFWRSAAVGTCGTGPWSGTWWFSLDPLATLARDHTGINPTFSLTKSGITYSVMQTSPVAIRLYDMSGKEMIGFSGVQPEGSYSFMLANRNLAAGNYVLRFAAGNFEKSAVVPLAEMR
jgi:hypothetical protein